MKRAAIYLAIDQALPDDIRHTALWNQDVEFADMGEAFARPACFVEFDTMELQPVKPDVYRVKGVVRLHLVVDFDTHDTMEIFELTDKVIASVTGVSGTDFRINYPQSIYTNHNHEDLLEEIVAFSYSCEMAFNNSL